MHVRYAASTVRNERSVAKTKLQPMRQLRTEQLTESSAVSARAKEKKKAMEEDMDIERRQLIEKKVEVQMILSRLSSTSKMVEFLKTSIKKKEEDLECPICLEPAKPPIFIWCQASHIICSACVPNLEECPQCRMGLTITMKRFFSEIYFLFHRFFPQAPLC